MRHLTIKLQTRYSEPYHFSINRVGEITSGIPLRLQDDVVVHLVCNTESPVDGNEPDERVTSEGWDYPRSESLEALASIVKSIKSQKRLIVHPASKFYPHTDEVKLHIIELLND